MASEVSPSLTPAQTHLLEKYRDAVISSPISLTGSKSAEDFWQRHILDAVALLEQVLPVNLETRLRVLDLGSGNGIPGIPLAVCRPNWIVVMLDSDSKKCLFLDTFCNINGIENTRVLTVRAETAAHEENREKYDYVIARALAKLPVAIELGGPFVRMGGALIVPHGTSWKEELGTSQKAISEIGLRLDETKRYALQDGPEFTALVFKKDHQTPDRYPRAIGIPKKRPLK